MQFRKKVYICSPYRDNPEENRKKALQYCRKAFEEGCLPVAPHIYFPQFLDETTEREQGQEMGLQLLSECQELWVFGPEVTEGMWREIEVAKKYKIPIRCYHFKSKELVSKILEGASEVWW
ncbi:DUF4406 domain-containing protein [Anaerocellum danielii]|uniref:DUF4406 domain-containing protein n=1 Tax=Anaerocellum danielii TaxID=1387557 RepID=A0ABZ0TZ62_9FIRM|nr:DUF4406 domain-containing protein [Caldicellulosiruptor danielii]WPX08147.1 DUF4406 domain-containing protein [Caldicellulosiruptor danielii]